MILGALHLQKKELTEALELFQRFQENTELRQDFESQAIAFNLLGCTYLGFVSTHTTRTSNSLISLHYHNLYKPSVYFQVKGPY